ncbi:hypothetical protein M1L60_23540 [Actinoplanes sp. TRM 88003]|uniref:Uncharacterized protein n=1 Tax=Paractinoplanes aksuensis TaxID=2939490 RepID=A0ABT1DRW1_9ACTN|nr:hypothetical protein [Actinoplanes aksuensis]MCO8273573.1 hypothetical protein [Actinoplanes aksuensis]
MNDLRDHLQQIAGPIPAATDEQIAADLTRGRRALRRRRVVQACTGSAFGIAALAAAIAIATSTTGAPPAPSSPDRITASVQLVAYKGEQPKGFTVDKVPDGWFVQTSELGYVTIAPDKAKNPGPDVDPSADPVYNKDSFVDKIAVMLESKDQSGPGREGKTVKVGDRDGILVKSLEKPDANGDSGWTLWVKQPNGIYLLVQVWQGLGLTESQIVELGAGVHVEKDAVQGVG